MITHLPLSQLKAIANEIQSNLDSVKGWSSQAQLESHNLAGFVPDRKEGFVIDLLIGRKSYSVLVFEDGENK